MYDIMRELDIYMYEVALPSTSLSRKCRATELLVPVLHLHSGTCVMSSKNASKHDDIRARLRRIVAGGNFNPTRDCEA